MDCKTGKIYDQDEFRVLDRLEKNRCIKIHPSELSELQKKNKRVSLRDNNSPAGKLRIKSYNSLRNKP